MLYFMTKRLGNSNLRYVIDLTGDSTSRHLAKRKIHQCYLLLTWVLFFFKKSQNIDDNGA